MNNVVPWAREGDKLWMFDVCWSSQSVSCVPIEFCEWFVVRLNGRACFPFKSLVRSCTILRLGVHRHEQCWAREGDKLWMVLFVGRLDRSHRVLRFFVVRDCGCACFAVNSLVRSCTILCLGVHRDET